MADADPFRMTWRVFRKWAGFPVWEDMPVCEHGFKMNLGEWPAYDWVCDHDPRRAANSHSAPETDA